MLWIPLLVLVAFLGLAWGIGYFVFSAPIYSGPQVPHFTGKRFLNPEPREGSEGIAVLKWALNRKKGPWERNLDLPYGPKPPPEVSGGKLRVTFVNHATMLVQLDGLNILFDPIWSERASPLSFAGPRRMRPPGIRFEDLPRIDAVLISHNHYDHLDVPTLKRLVAEHDPQIYAGLGNAAFLKQQGIESQDLDWHQEAEIAPGSKVIAVPVQHFSGRGLGDRDGTLWTGYVVDSPSGPVYFAGDTGWGEHFRLTRERYGRPRAALLPVGAYLPRWFMSPVHIDPEYAVRAHEALEAGTSIAMHFGTFQMADDGETEPIDELKKALASRSPAPRFWVLEAGEGKEIPPLSSDEEGRAPAKELENGRAQWNPEFSDSPDSSESPDTPDSPDSPDSPKTAAPNGVVLPKGGGEAEPTLEVPDMEKAEGEELGAVPQDEGIQER